MKKTLSLLLSLVLLLGCLSVSALATSEVASIETPHFTMENAMEKTVDGTTYYESTNYVTITLNQDLWWVGMNYHADGKALPMDPTTVNREGNPIMDTDITVMLPSTGETMDYYDWFQAHTDGTLTWDDTPIWLAGSTFTLHVFGEFYFFACESEKDSTMYLVDVVMPDDAVPDQSGIAQVTASTVFVDGEEVSFDAYKINDNNYFKLRDIATVLSGSDKQFSVDWDDTAYAISLVSDQSYTPVGGELEVGDGTDKDYIPTEANLYINGTLVNLTAYEIQGNNYFKLRDLGQLFDFNVSWDSQANAISVDTTATYTPD